MATLRYSSAAGNIFRLSPDDTQNVALETSTQGPYGNLELFDTEAPLIDLSSDDGYEDLYGVISLQDLNCRKLIIFASSRLILKLCLPKAYLILIVSF